MTGGFAFDRTQSQGDTTGKEFLYDVASTHSTRLSPGDVVRITGTASADGVPQADAAAAAQSITGILFAVTPTFAGEALSETGLPATVGGSIVVNVDPFALYDVDVSNGTLVIADTGLNIDLVATAATTTGGLTISNMTVDAGTIATTQTLPFRIVQILDDDGGTFGGRARVRVNNSTISDGAAGV